MLLDYFFQVTRGVVSYQRNYDGICKLGIKLKLTNLHRGMYIKNIKKNIHLDLILQSHVYFLDFFKK